MEYLLTIAIPTYNRGETLAFCLRGLLPQIAGKSIELLVSDNASTDNTQSIMEVFCQEHPEITYIRNPENIGPDRNFLNCYNYAHGEYVLLLGDDDLLLPDALDEILSALQRKPVFVHLNTCGLFRMNPPEFSPPRVPEGDICSYHNRNDFLLAMGIYVTFLSSFILRNDLVRKIENKEQYIGTYFIQSHIALRTLAEPGEYLFVRKNCIAASGNQSVSYDLYFVWGQMYGELLRKTAVQAGIDPSVAEQLHHHDLKNLIWQFVTQLRGPSKGSANWNKACILNEVKPYKKLYLRYWLAVNLPAPLFSFIQNAIRTIKKIAGK